MYVPHHRVLDNDETTPKLVYDVLVSTFLLLIRSEGPARCVQLLEVNRTLNRCLEAAFYEDIFISKQGSLLALLETLRNDNTKVSHIKKIHIQIGCQPAIVPRAGRRRATPNVRCPVQAQVECNHLGIHQHQMICGLLGLGADTMKELVIHSSVPLIPVTNFVRSTTFASVISAQIPAEMVCFPRQEDTSISFPVVEQLMLAVTRSLYDQQTAVNMDLKGHTRLRHLLLSFWRVDERLIVESFLQIRTPKSLVCCAVECNRGLQFPVSMEVMRKWTAKGWMLVLIDPYVVDTEGDEWRQFIRYADHGPLSGSEVHEYMSSMIMYNDVDASVLWDRMEIQVQARRTQYRHNT